MRKILILTPDGVGSTLLQRSACAWGNLTDIWINPHELTNGLAVKDGFLQKDWSLGYSQSLPEIVNLLSRERENLIGRVAQYHIVARKDEEEDLRKFYEFLNTEFEIISCHRRNVFEYAMSWTIRDLKKTLNVYSYKQKEQIHPPTDSFELDIDYLAKKLDDYAEYERWLNDNFQIKHQFYYEDVLSMDQFLASTVGGSANDVRNRFGLSLGDYCLISNHSKDQMRCLDEDVLKAVLSLRKYFHELVNLGRMPNTVPLKMNSFKSKIRKTINFDEILAAYNTWAKSKNDHHEINAAQLQELIEKDPFSV